MKRLIIAFVMIWVIFAGLAGAAGKIDRPIPFLCQAPYGDWRQPWQDACEEAAIIMAMGKIKGEKVNREKGKRAILALVNWQIKNWGGHYDLTAEQSAKLIKDYYKYDGVEVREAATIQELKKLLADGNLIIAPMAGRELKNPYFTPPGPYYHYLLIKGYDEAGGVFIANDPGTRRGANYRYKFRVLFRAIHDWTGNKKTIDQGRKAIIVVK
ncbi:hypothetical protein A3K48_04065 [candidate division WOR-1 bacterium RIFOXYA12_FULL_52_29]|uniref:Peptidase C39-like domain-containing protein n=1 Tax=candidate division WOR-1 bacterium RIFOXYC12_FULL_54_18 TaxID=1802584 RepID=A0A1F4T6C7_UNCSA|nr:MAG: hypothetical protein A3K44_04065 [candidate division WOR-1 bacterium RIFOXYA2_FULL_51_19]OGC17729.1 MAG: hypothetical protein A3K48_04065 [candidate division WOR-1 bacterium RIFOXYA12_FULL_52_29]OGC26586.1 MAG: hypothetical protein A3K32_04060 [candidate division WOR-1 bacterium RIFOXYB2_FULL_45_9]OGC28146.1 MAG: hypothetical protein A3K49_04065 [candidate division WOR-1 bacterium RIFOXYC12_FULL_54_18]OGC29568.1 MAG: hypothetical protein A2346_02270 [candidate division WOR-1 bacterium R